MSKCLLLVQNPAAAAAMHLILVEKHGLSEADVFVETVGTAPTSRGCANEFSRLADVIEEKLPNAPSVRTSLLVCTDLHGYDRFVDEALNPLSGRGWGPVLGMLVLAFPEVHWVLLGKRPEKWPDWGDACWADNYDLNRIVELRAVGYCPLFDSSGLRAKVRHAYALGQGSTAIGGVVPDRLTEEAAAVDEEADYAFFHGYIAYRFGFRSHIATTRQMLDELVGKRILPKRAAGLTLVFEDLYLNFPDHHTKGFANLSEVRDKECPYLSSVKRRVFITSGHSHGITSIVRHENIKYLQMLRRMGMWNIVLGKPIGGIYKVWSDSQLSARVGAPPCRGYAEGFRPVARIVLDPEQTPIGHGAPGRVLELTNRLIARAGKLIPSVSTAQAAVYGAVLASDALELLAGFTPTASLEALSLKHQFEVLAECQFLGVEGSFDVKSRIKELRREIRSVAHWYDARIRRFAEWNAEAVVLRRLIRVFRQNNQFNEEQQLQIRERQLHLRIWFRRNLGWFGDELRVFNPVYWAAAYVGFLLRSITTLLLAIAGWVAGLTISYKITSTLDAGDSPWLRGIEAAITSFFGVSPPAGYDVNRHLLIVVVVAMLAGFLHLGVLISHLYAISSRR